MKRVSFVKKDFWQVRKENVEWRKLILIIYDKINIKEMRMKELKDT